MQYTSTRTLIFSIILFLTAGWLWRSQLVSQAAVTNKATVPFATCTWDGTSGDWTNTAKWSCGAVPGPGDTATINGGTVRVIASAGTYDPTTVYTILTSSGARTVSERFVLLERLCASLMVNGRTRTSTEPAARGSADGRGISLGTRCSCVVPGSRAVIRSSVVREALGSELTSTLQPAGTSASRYTP